MTRARLRAPVRWRWALGLALGSTLLLSACRSETRLFLTIEGDLQVPDDADQLLVELRSDDATFQTSHALTRPAPHLSETLAISEGQQIRGQVDIVVHAHKGNRRVASGATTARFVEDATVPVTVRLTLAPDVEDAGVPDDGGNTGDLDSGGGDDRPDGGLGDAGLGDAGLGDASG